MKIEENIERILITGEELQKRIAELGRQITEDYQGQQLTMACILNGAVMFYSDLVRRVDLPVHYDFMRVSSYAKGVMSTGVVKIHKDLDEDITGRHLLLVEDIIDSGNTLSYLKEYFLNRKAASVKICTLLDKPERRLVPVQVDYVGFTIPNEFIVGYGLDYAEDYRNLPYVGILKHSVYE